MKNNLIKLLGIFIIIIIIVFSFGRVYAENLYQIDAEGKEYSDEYKKWLELDEEERKNTIEPKMYETTNIDNNSYLKNMNNVFKVQQLVRASIPTQYDLKNIIPENVRIRNQMQTNACWAFVTLGVLESHLGLKDKNALANTVAYDFSERHMNYAMTKSAFFNNQINEYGFSRAPSDGGNFWMATAYLTNGLGAVDENALPFENNEDNIDISNIQNKEVKTTLYDTKEFDGVTSANRNQVIQSMKEHIMNYGGIYANMYGPDLYGDVSYNNATGAIYCKDSEAQTINHAVVIIGWDDNYSIDNFNEEQRPQNNGAWIVKNSWGETLTQKLLPIKQQFFEQLRDECEENGWYTPEQIPDSEILFNLKKFYGEDKVEIQGEDVIIEVGNDGYMYISYEDATIYSSIAGIEKATASKDYDSVYQNDYLGAGGGVTVTTPGELNLANVFKRDSSKQEELDKVSVYSYQGYEYKVYVNPNGDSKAQNDLIEVKLKEGDTQSVGAGYHVLEFADPIRLTGDSFVVVLQLVNTDGEKVVALESKVDDSAWAEAIVNTQESFWANENGFRDNQWEDLATRKDFSGNLCIKAYTNDVEAQAVELSEIYIEEEPTKTIYQEGENFDKTGMRVIARYSDGSTKEVTDYDVIGGENLTQDITSVTIRYTENGIIKTTTQPITVNSNETEITLSEIYIEEEPTKTVYEEGENFDAAGMVVIARYSDGSSKEIENYDVIGGENLKAGTTSVTISYTENGVTKTTEQSIIVNKGQVVLSGIYVSQSPNKISYQEGENFDKTGMKVIATYSDGSSKEITNYEVIGGENLTSGTTSVTISYTENGVTKTTEQSITVNQEEAEVVLVEIYVEQEPEKIEYQEGENFDATGMKVIARYSDGSSKEITNYEVIGGENLTINTTSVTIRYSENGVIRSTTQEITVKEKENPNPGPEPGEDPDTSKEPVPSNFTDSKAEITETKLYFYSTDLSNLTGEITIKVTGIKLGDESNTYEHYCYLSGTQGDKNINDWKKVQITKESDGTYSITWTVKPEDLSNYEELIESDNLYLYIKEIASVDGKSVENVVTLDVDNQSAPQCYIDGKYVGGIDDVLNYNKGNGNNNNNNNGDNTTASGKLPYAGRTILIIVSVLAIAGSGVFAYHRYRNIDR